MTQPGDSQPGRRPAPMLPVPTIWGGPRQACGSRWPLPNGSRGVDPAGHLTALPLAEEGCLVHAL